MISFLMAGDIGILLPCTRTWVHLSSSPSGAPCYETKSFGSYLFKYTHQTQTCWDVSENYHKLDLWAIYLAEHLGTIGLRGFVGGAVHTHGLPVAGELQGELFLPHLLDDMGSSRPLLSLAQVGFVGVVVVHLLSQNSQCSLRSLSYLLIHILTLQNRTG